MHLFKPPHIIHLILTLCLLISSTLHARVDPRMQLDSTASDEAKAAITQTVIATYQTALDNYSDTEQLINAPMSGERDWRGRNLLTFAAFNRLPELAKWALANGADINCSDKNRATMLSMALMNYQIDMLRFALEHGANPNAVAGNDFDNMLSRLVKWTWPIDGFLLAAEFGAKPRNEFERSYAINYVRTVSIVNHNGEVLRAQVLEYLQNAPLATFPLQKAASSDIIVLNMTEQVDQQLLIAMQQGTLSTEVMDTYSSKGKSFASFLAFNGFSEALNYHLQQIHNGYERVIVRDAEGYDLLIAAIKSRNANTVRVVLAQNPEAVNSMVPVEQYSYNAGRRPLHIAIESQAPPAVFEQLIQYGADPSLKDSRGNSAIQLLRYYQQLVERRKLSSSSY